ncbi:hypothetical protein PAMP_004706 [Pampus punctatissimus]
MGVELDRRTAREKEWEAGGGAKALLLTREDMAKEKAVVDGATQLERRDLRQVKEGGGSKRFWRGEGAAAGARSLQSQQVVLYSRLLLNASSRLDEELKTGEESLSPDHQDRKRSLSLLVRCILTTEKESQGTNLTPSFKQTALIPVCHPGQTTDQISNSGCGSYEADSQTTGRITVR